MIMKKTLRFLAMALMAGAMLTACGGDDDDTGGGGGGGGTGEGPIPGVTVDNKLSGSVKAGFAGAIEITGSGFDPELDWVFIGYDDGGKTTYVRITTDVLTIKTGRITFGVSIDAAYLDKTFKVYLDRAETKMELTNDLTFTMPTVAEGYIPDPYFRATLRSLHSDQGNPDIAALFNAYGLIDVSAAAAIKKCGHADYGLNLYACQAKSLEGIELFKNIEGTVAAWGMDAIEEIDLSKWEASSTGNIAFFINGVPNLKKFIGSPNGYLFNLYDCPKLEYVDLSKAQWAYNIQLFYDTSETGFSAVTYLDMRKDRSGTEMGGPAESDKNTWKGYPHAATEWAPFLSGAWFKVADNCHILVDYQFLVDKWKDAGSVANPDGSGYGTIYNAWKRGATIDVYSSKNIEKKLGTVPMYKDDPGALTLTGANGWVPAETE